MFAYSTQYTKIQLLYPDNESKIAIRIVHQFHTPKDYYFKSLDKLDKDNSFAGWDYFLGTKISINSGGNIARK